MNNHSTLAATLGVVLAVAGTVGGSVHGASPTSTERVWVKFRPGASAQVESSLRAAGARFHYRFADLRAFAVSVPSQALAGLRSNPNIEYVEADAPRYPLGEVVPYGITNVQAPQAVTAGADGTGIKVCVIDSGIKADHEDFAGVVMSGYPTSGWSTDTCGHGTHVAGTVAAVGGNAKGVVGVSPGKVSLHLVKVFDGASCGWSYSSTLVDAAQKCQGAGAKIISMSLGGSFKSTTEETAFANLDAAGILSIAAAGNAGNSTFSYPASYASVMSVAAVDSNNVKADFSQYNSQVDISGPGVGVLSTYPFKSADVTVAGTSYLVSAMEGSIQANASGALVSGGRCTSAGSWSGKVVLCERGDITFADKVANVTAGGGVAAVVYNNVPGGFSGTLGTGVTSSIPAVSMTQEDGQSLVASQLGQTASVSTVYNGNTSGYAYLDGTSMATPHVSGVAALVWSADATRSNQQIRDALTATALDLGAAGRDNSYGYGLVQAYEAVVYLEGGGGGGGTGISLSGTAYKVKGRVSVNLAWSGAISSNVDVYRNDGKIATTPNDGAYTDATGLRGGGSLTYRVCEAASTTCSATITVTY